MVQAVFSLIRRIDSQSGFRGCGVNGDIHPFQGVLVFFNQRKSIGHIFRFIPADEEDPVLPKEEAEIQTGNILLQAQGIQLPRLFQQQRVVLLLRIAYAGKNDLGVTMLPANASGQCQRFGIQF